MTTPTPRIIKETQRGYDALEVSDVLFSERKIFISEQITPEMNCNIIKQLMLLDEEPEKEITVYISSPGGCVDSGLAIYDVMRSLKSPLKTVCVGKAASMGAILFLAGDKRVIQPRSEVMIHDPSYGEKSYSGQKPHEIKKELDSLIKKRDILCDIIAERTGKPIKDVRKKTETDSYFDAKEALEFGLATEIGCAL